MINFTKINPHSIVGNIARAPLHLIPKKAVVPIIQGPLRGKKWVVGSGIHRYWLGSYEFDKQRVFAEFIKPGAIVLDIGANVGFYTLLSSVLVGPAGHVYAFEPLPANAAYLKTHLTLNSSENVSLFNLALSDSEGFAMFEPSATRSTGRISESGGLKVETSTLDRLVESGKVAVPSVVKIDVEGAEMRVLTGGRNTFQTAKPLILLATHGTEVHKACCDLLRKWGFSLSSPDGSDIDSTDELIARHS